MSKTDKPPDFVVNGDKLHRNKQRNLDLTRYDDPSFPLSFFIYFQNFNKEPSMFLAIKDGN